MAESCKELFDLFDDDKSGLIDFKEFTTGIRAQGVPYTNGQVKTMFEEADVTKRGELNFAEFEGVYKKVKDAQAAQAKTDNLTDELTEIFNMLDEDKNGYLDKSELATLMKSFGDAFTDEEADKAFADIDDDGDGKISLHEFLQLHGAKVPNIPYICYDTLKDTKKNLKKIETTDRTRLPTVDEIKVESSFRSEAEARLQEGISQLKKAETTLKSVMPTTDAIEAEKSATEKAEAALTQGRKSLKSTETIDRTRLPTADDLKAELNLHEHQKMLKSTVARKSLKKTKTEEKLALPSKEDLEAEKKEVEAMTDGIKEVLSGMFKLYDLDSSGSISMEENLKVDKVLCDAMKVPFSEERAKALFNAADKNKDQQVSPEEFMTAAYLMLIKPAKEGGATDESLLAMLTQTSAQLTEAKAEAKEEVEF